MIALLGFATASATAAAAPSTAPAASSANGQLLGVACSAVTACTAVGEYLNSANHYAPLAESLNGTTWQSHAAANPPGSTYTALKGVTCRSATDCFAVGYYTSASGTPMTLAELWNGSTWKRQVTPNPTGSTSSSLNAVACPSASECIAVGGSEVKPGSDATLAEVWNGSKWTLQSVPNVTGATSTVLAGVSCFSATGCTAAGYSIAANGNVTTFAAGWNGLKWTVQSTPNPAGATTSLFYGVSCPTSSACFAAGSANTGGDGINQTLTERWNGKQWQLQKSANGAGYSALEGVSCSDATSCTAVGYVTNENGTGQTLAVRLSGSTWRLQTTANPSGSIDTELLGVSCFSSTACTAAGLYVSGAGEELTVAEGWNGSTWELESTRNAG